MFGADLSFGHLLGDRFEEPVLIVRFATYDPVWFQRGSRSLGKDYLPPRQEANPISPATGRLHYNCGVWDATYTGGWLEVLLGRRASTPPRSPTMRPTCARCSPR